MSGSFWLMMAAIAILFIIVLFLGAMSEAGREDEIEEERFTRYMQKKFSLEEEDEDEDAGDDSEEDDDEYDDDDDDDMN